MANDRVAVVVLAAGAGTRMKSSVPKPLHPVAGQPMLWHVLQASESVRPEATVVVLSPAIAASPAWKDAHFGAMVAIQDPPLGTGDAVRVASSETGDCDWIVVLFADGPLLMPATVARMVQAAKESAALVTLLTCHLPEAGPYGRIERDPAGRITRIVERKDDDPSLRQVPSEINSGLMVLRAEWAKRALARIQPSPVTGEFYLPELVRMAVEETNSGPWPVAAVNGDWDEVRGVNDRSELADADAILRRRIRHDLMLAGVTMILPESIAIDAGVVIGPDTVIEPGCVIRRGTIIGAGCTIGPQALLDRAVIGDRVAIRQSTVVDSEIAEGADAGPYAHIRSGCRIGARAHIGNYAELKNAHIGEDVRVGHFCYIGDAEIGARTNIGAGTITCNYDGVDKHRTVIGEDAFIGSDSMLVAPVRIGDRARTGAGSVVTKDVGEETTVVGVPARVIRRSGERAKRGGE